MTTQIDSNKAAVESDAELPTEHGNFRIRAFAGPDGKEHATLYTGDFRMETNHHLSGSIPSV